MVRSFALVFALLFAIAGYQEARRFAKQYGRTPWGWDPWVWAIVMFVSWVVGLILLAIAERQGRNRAKHWRPPVDAAVAPGPAWSLPVVESPTWSPVVPAAPQPAAQWAADPTGRNDYRWWDGQAWTSHVSTNGATGTDPI